MTPLPDADASTLAAQFREATLREHGQQPGTREFGSSGLQHNQAPRSNSKDQMSKAVEAAGGMVASLQ